MPKIIFISRYLKKSAKENANNLIDYLATREGAEKFTPRQKFIKATAKQQEWIERELKNYPDIKNTFEYDDYIKNPNVINASELIVKISELAMQNEGYIKQYVNYISYRPGAESAKGLFQNHALWNGEDKIIDLNKVKKEIGENNGYLWTHVISLRREDATRLGFESAAVWRDLVKSKIPLIAENMKIPLENLKWYAAFHNESHHPHIHLIVYSENPREGYLTKTGIENMRREFATEIFHDDMYQIYSQKDDARKSIKDYFDSEFLKASSIQNKTNPKAEVLLSKLANNLINSKYHIKYHIYSRLTKENKVLVDEIMEELSNDEKVRKLYETWIGLKEDIILTYRNQGVPRKKLVEESEFKSIKNKIIKYAMEIRKCPLPESKDMGQEGEPKDPEQIMDLLSTESEGDDSDDNEDVYSEQNIEPEEVSNEIKKWIFKTYWTPNFKKAKEILKDADVTTEDIEIAYGLFFKESKKDNPFAMYQSASLTAKGKGIDKNEILAQEYYGTAFNAFLSLEEEHPNDLTEFYLGSMYRLGNGVNEDFEQASKWYLKSAEQGNSVAQYAIGKMHYEGVGVSQSYDEAVKWYEKSSFSENAYAQYALGKMHYSGIGVAQSYEYALKYIESASGDIPFAAYKAAVMYQEGIGTDVHKEKAMALYKKAYEGFLITLKSEEDKEEIIEYKLGKMFQNGLGIPVDVQSAESMYLSSARKGNQFAQYALAKLYFKGKDLPKNISSAIYWLEKSAEQDNASALYTLAKLYYDGVDVLQDYTKAFEYFILAGEIIPFATYKIAEMYETGKGTEINQADAKMYYRKAYGGFVKLIAEGKDLDGGITYLIAKMHLDGKGIDKNTEHGYMYMLQAAEKKNVSALFLLIKKYVKGEWGFSVKNEDAQNWLNALVDLAENEDDFAQFSLGYYYLFSKDDSNINQAIKWLKESEAQGNEMAPALLKIAYEWLENQTRYAFMRLTKNLSRMLENDYCRLSGIHMRTESKLLRKMMEKKLAQGQKM